MGLIDELADARTPDYLEAAIEQASSRPQRPAWTFPERWLPMADITSRSTFAPRLPWRTIAVALVILALLIGAAVVYVGTRQPHLPPPFGVARNGLITYAKNGDIYTVDPTTGVATAVVTSPENEIDPEFSLDGTRLMFSRQRGDANAYDQVVSNADGSAARVVTNEPLTTDDFAALTPDASAIIASNPRGIVRWDTAAAGDPTVLAQGRFIAGGAIRSTDGAILFENDDTPGIDLWVMRSDGSDKRLLWDPQLDGNFSDIQEYRWSPDGTMIAYTCSDPESHVGSNVCVMNADGSDPHQLTHEGADWWEDGLQWSPDGRSLAFLRHQQAPGATSYLNRPIGIVPVSGGPIIELGPTPPVDTDFAWSPDGTTLLTLPSLQSSHLGASAVKPTEIDVATGDVHEMPFDVASSPSWQRAPLD